MIHPQKDAWILPLTKIVSQFADDIFAFGQADAGQESDDSHASNFGKGKERMLFHEKPSVQDEPELFELDKENDASPLEVGFSSRIREAMVYDSIWTGGFPNPRSDGRL